jgi:tripartite-type tricarboxylate transporter receptor subunit TctC
MLKSIHALFFLLAAVPALAQAPAEDFYRGKTVTFMINFTVGGSTDIEGRIWARHLQKHLPGNPNVIVQNMGGAGGTIGTNWLAQVARPDGLTLAYLTGSTGKQALGESQLIDMNSLSYLGNSPDVNMTYARTDIPPGLKAPVDLMKAKNFWIGGLSPDSSKDVIERLQLEMLGIPFKYISGYKGSPEARLALQKGEIQFYNEGIASWFASIEPGLARSGEVLPLWFDPMDDGVEMRRPPDAAGVPALPFHEFFVQATGKQPGGQMWDMYRRANLFTTTYLRVFMMPPKTPQHIVDIVTKAFAETAADPEFKTETKNTLQRTPDFKSGAATEAAFHKMLAPNPVFQTFMAEFIEKGRRTMGAN